MRPFLTAIFLSFWSLYAAAVGAVELIMVEQPGCVYCRQWNKDLAPIYPKTEVGQFAPLRHVKLSEIRGGDLDLNSPVIFTPTFLLIEGNVEIGRLEGYASEDFFWPMLELLLEDKTDFQGSTK